MGDALAQAQKTIPAEIHMISGCQDSQTSVSLVETSLWILFVDAFRSTLEDFAGPPLRQSHRRFHTVLTFVHRPISAMWLPSRCPTQREKPVGALTSCLLNVTYKDHKNTGSDLSFQDTLMKVREELSQKGYEQIPHLTSSRPMDIHKKFDIVPDDMTGTKRAVMM